MSRILTTVAALAATTLLSGAAFAGCNTGTYCGGGSSLAPLSSWSGSSSTASSYMAPTYTTPSYSTSSYSAPTYSSGTSYASGTSYSGSSYGSSYGGVMSSSVADATYGTGSISSAYAGGDVQMYGFSGSTASVPGLGNGESLQTTNCPVNVYNPTGARVIGCYNVVKQVPQTNYVRVVRPVVYVRYPVPTPVAVPYYVNQPQSRCGAAAMHFARYAGYPMLPRRGRCG